MSDLTALRGMPLALLDLHEANRVSSIKSLEGMPLEYLNLTALKVDDLAALRGMTSLRRLILPSTPVADLAPIHDLKLKELSIQSTMVSDLSPLEGMELTTILFIPKSITKGLEFVRGMKSLKTIGVAHGMFWPAAEFWERYDKGEFGVAPFADADVKRIAALPVAEQVEEVRKELMRRNPGFDGGVVTELNFVTDKVADISPVAALIRLQKLIVNASAVGKNGLLDLSPLSGMKLTHLNANYNNVRDLIPLRGMPLTELFLIDCPISDLAPLKGMALEQLYLWNWTGSDLTPLAGMPLKQLNLGGGGQKLDLASLAGMPLEIR